MSEKIDRNAFVARAMRDAEHRSASPTADAPSLHRERSVVAIWANILEAGELTGQEREAKVEETLDLIHADPDLTAAFTKLMDDALGAGAATRRHTVAEGRAANRERQRGLVTGALQPQRTAFSQRRPLEGQWMNLNAPRIHGEGVPVFRNAEQKSANQSLYVDDPQGVYRIIETRIQDDSGLFEVILNIYTHATTLPIVASRDDWQVYPILDGNELPVVPELSLPTAWKLDQPISPEDLARIVYDVEVLSLLPDDTVENS